ncbi:LPS export ABC transporter periplasmic protein LptC [Jannaschia aquimarina]|uniref:Lipopolysaccharide-assembly protein LptC n=1 Tax=Jannaschia aquimarina TaxID=935700 RepID=A0A0D1EGY3_9RHOB|nr:LPS export ABC transporter periplasmic protein LptC [Jannaschia aquimarina]KIT15110.1 Lipopolysaccharide-assembly protein LptC [Jannaschia aquimarina]SNS64346.1 lipopolysaccharide export system protein LptC [Jannaschia aquimarina]
MIQAVGHTRLVRGTKILLPLIALSLLSTLFLLADRVDPDDALPYAEVDVSERARDQQLTSPRVMGRTTGGTSFDLTAETARPDARDPNRLTIDMLRLDLSGDGGATISAAAGMVNTGTRTLVLEGDVNITTTTGYEVRTERLEGALGDLRIASPGKVTGDGPLGRLTAGAMEIVESDGTQRLRFTGGVDLLYEPATE